MNALNALRIPLAAIGGTALTLGMFSILWHLVSGAIDATDLAEARRIEFSRMRRDSEVETKREERVERELPPAIPEVPRISLAMSGVSNNVARINPIVDARGAMTGLTLSAGSDQDVIPLVRIPPEYPPRALARAQEGWVQVQFTITETGMVKDPIVVRAEPRNVFDEAALRAVARWRYNPKVEGGIAVERVGVQTIVRFELLDE